MKAGVGVGVIIGGIYIIREVGGSVTENIGAAPQKGFGTRLHSPERQATPGELPEQARPQQ